MDFPPPASAQPAGYPARLDITPMDRIARWRPLFQWILAIPHLIIAQVLTYVAQIVAFIGWFVILFTGKLPVGMANLMSMCQRYNTRTMTYAAGLLDAYPPFEFETTPNDAGTYPAKVEFAPALENRNRLTVGLRIIWAIPALIVSVIIGIIGIICWFIGAIVVLFTGAWPTGLRDWVLKAIRANLRVSAYLLLLTDEYPPLSFD
jgi:hypothetical protein